MLSSLRPRFLRTLLGALGVLSVGGCALVLGIEAPELDVGRANDADAVTDGEGAEGGLLDGSLGGDGAADVAGPDARDAALCTADGGVEAGGIFVAPAPVGSPNANCGTKALPCATVQRGVDRAKAVGEPMVYVAHGTYVESVTLKPGVAIEGGWEVLGAAWTRSCVTPLRDAVVIEAPLDSAMTIVAANLQGDAALRRLTVRSKASASVLPGESLYGVFATGGSTNVTLDDVVVEVGEGGAGTSGDVGTTPAIAGTNCTAGSGANAATPGPNGAGALAGGIGPTGYVTSARAEVGVIGKVGNNGLKTTARTCVNCYSCGAAVCSTTALAQSCGTEGPIGCAGAAGGGGAIGTSGGASIGVFAWGARVTIEDGRVKSGPGGKGGAGGGGGGGGAGGPGGTGTDGAICVGSCNGLLPCDGPTTKGLAGVGGSGGSGSAGGTGGGGAGGPSYAIAKGGGALVQVAGGALLEHGLGGTSDGNGAAGGSGDLFP